MGGVNVWNVGGIMARKIVISNMLSIDLVNYDETIRFRFFRWGFLFHYQEAINRIKKLWVKR